MLFFSVKTLPIRTNRLQKPQFSNHALPHLSYLQSLPHSQNPYASISCITNDLCTLEKTIGGIPPKAELRRNSSIPTHWNRREIASFVYRPRIASFLRSRHLLPGITPAYFSRTTTEAT